VCEHCLGRPQTECVICSGRSLSVYMAGPINGCTDEEAFGWRRMLKEKYGGIGIRWVDPLDRDYRGRERSNWEDIVDNDIIAIRKSDAMLAYLWKKDQPYFGTSMEFVYAKFFGIPIVAIMTDSGITITGDKLKDEIRRSGATFHPWIQYHCEKSGGAVVKTLEEAVEVIRRL
jgi:nucleoside 2-deoxyribosyltransferase